MLGRVKSKKHKAKDPAIGLEVNSSVHGTSDGEQGSALSSNSSKLAALLKNIKRDSTQLLNQYEKNSRILGSRLNTETVY